MDKSGRFKYPFQVPSHSGIQHAPFRKLSRVLIVKQTKSLAKALKTYSKKTGAGSNKTSYLPENSQSQSAMSSLLDVTSTAIDSIHIILTFKDQNPSICLDDSPLYMWAFQFERLLANLIRILNDRMCMLFRKNVALPVESCCNLCQDIVLVSKLFQKFVTIIVSEFTSRSDVLVSKISSIGSGMISRARHHTSKTLPHLQRHVEMLLVSKLSVKVQSIANNCLSRKSFCVTGQSHVEVAGEIKNQILNPSLNCFKTYCTSNACTERLMTATTNACVDSLLAYIKEKRLPFNEAGVFVLHSQVDSMLQWVRLSKTELGYAPSNAIILDLTPWHKANGVMHVLLAATGGVLPKRPRSSGTELSAAADKQQVRLLTIFEQERWAELGEPPKWPCVTLGKNSFCTGRSATVSISPILDMRDL